MVVVGILASVQPAHAGFTITAVPPLASSFTAGACDLAPGARASQEDATPLCSWSSTPDKSNGKSTLRLKLAGAGNLGAHSVAGYSIRFNLPSDAMNVRFTVTFRIDQNQQIAQGAGWESIFKVAAAPAMPQCAGLDNSCLYPPAWKRVTSTSGNHSLTFDEGPYDKGIRTIYIWTFAELRIGGHPCVDGCLAVGVPGAAQLDATYKTTVLSATARS